MANPIDPIPSINISEHHLWRDWFIQLRNKVLTTRGADSPSGITVGTSPYSYQNSGTSPVDIIVNGGTVSAIAFSRDNSTYYTLGTTSGMFQLSSGDYLKVTYTVAPTMTLVPR